MGAVPNNNATGAIPFLQNLGTTVANGVGGGSTQQLLQAEQGFMDQSNSQEIQNLQFQEGLQAQQNKYNNMMQQASENSQEAAKAQTYSQDVASARNTLTASDLQQIK